MKNELEIKQVPFMGNELMAARDDNGEIWAGVSWMCKGIGMSTGQTKNERLKIQSNLLLKEGGRTLILPTKGGNQETMCLKLDYVPLWLAKISITPAMQEETPELAEKLKQYQLKAKDVLAAAFLPSNVKHKPRKTEAYSLQSVNNAAKIISSALEKAGVSSSSIAFSLKRLYQKAEIDIELDSVKAEKPYYLKEAIAKRLGEETDLQPMSDQDLHCMARILQSNIFTVDKGFLFGCSYCAYSTSCIELLEKSNTMHFNTTLREKLEKATGVYLGKMGSSHPEELFYAASTQEREEQEERDQKNQRMK